MHSNSRILTTRTTQVQKKRNEVNTFSKSKREGWNRKNPRQPYVDPTSVLTPGPGEYHPQLSSIKNDMSLKPRAGFATSEERFKDGHSVNLPGPGHYTTVNMNVDRADTNGYFGTSFFFSSLILRRLANGY